MDTLQTINNKIKSSYNLAADKYHTLFKNEIKEKEYDRLLLDSFTKLFVKGAKICDAGCGPSGHIGRYIFNKGLSVTGIDISERCIELASTNNPDMSFECADLGNMPFKDGSFDGIISYYSIINTPKIYLSQIFLEFNRVIKPGGYLLTTVKYGDEEGYLNSLLNIKTEVYFSLFKEEEIADYYKVSGFRIEFLEKRNPYDFEINNARIFALGKKEHN